MTLTDAGPLLALLDRSDQHHPRSVAVARRLSSGPLLTTWPCFTEAMYLLGEAGGYRYQAALWSLRSTGRLVLHEISPDEADRMAALMEKYRDVPMDLADASLVVVAESRSLKSIFTFDRHFHIYRLENGAGLEVVPSAS